MYIITNGDIVTEDKILKQHAVYIKENVIERIVPMAEVVTDGYEVIDANGGIVSPGFIDIHSDYIEGIIAPRPTSLMDFSIGIRESERILLTHGITTMYHSLSIYKRDAFGHKPIRQPQNVDKLIREIDNTHSEKHLMRHRLHARFEIDSVEQLELLEEHLLADRIQLLSFMDHTPGQGQYRDIEQYKNTIKGYKDMDDNEIDAMILEYQSRPHITMDDIKRLSEIATRKNIAVASHDDESIDKIDFVKTFGTSISEFPITLEVAKKARLEGLHTVAGAPNVMLGGSHSGNLSAAKAILEDAITILCSDYYPQALVHAVFKMSETYGADLHRMFQLVTLNPAKAVNIDDRLGSIKPGKIADIIIIEKLEDNYPVVTTAMIDGKVVNQFHYRGARYAEG
ncbi:phosphonate metabolism protein PhnM [Macrococcoides caseolyticum]|uniref:phosphonate metabolism protein PhnM n=1 Tax=Macrococcoides caseolyticum TaxID=69966 RepID=UPI001F224072|nr:phosphonate metabolism protein PhnM [Macrococcus caseolyticus]MCE4956012.1 phosphonate metabolism protein PhnM [Macrococcus caseolyticus]